jgi:hypothetical protein
MKKKLNKNDIKPGWLIRATNIKSSDIYAGRPIYPMVQVTNVPKSGHYVAVDGHGNLYQTTFDKIIEAHDPYMRGKYGKKNPMFTTPTGETIDTDEETGRRLGLKKVSMLKFWERPTGSLTVTNPTKRRTKLSKKETSSLALIGIALAGLYFWSKHTQGVNND